MAEPIPAPDQHRVPRAHIKGLIASLGFEPSKVTRIEMTAGEVVVTTRRGTSFVTHQIPITD